MKNFLLVPIDHAVLYGQGSTHRMLEELIRLYANIWKFDPYFQEYMYCNVCGRYTSKESYVDNLQFVCTGTPEHPHEPNFLVDPWGLDNIREGFRTEFQDQSLKGWLLLTNTGQVLGFTWGVTRSVDDVRSRWKDGMDSHLLSEATDNLVCYYSELGVANHPSCRKQGYGRMLVYMLTKYFKDNFPDTITVLRTHRDSEAAKLYRQVGYQDCGLDPEHGQGRIMMAARCRDLNPNSLNPPFED